MIGVWLGDLGLHARDWKVAGSNPGLDQNRIFVGS